MGLTNYENLLEENSIYFDLNAINRNGIKVYSIEISTDELSYFEKYDVFLNVIYKNEKGKFVDNMTESDLRSDDILFLAKVNVKGTI